MTRPPARQWQTCCTVASSPWSSRASVAPGMKYLFINMLHIESLYGCLAAPCSMSMLSESCHVSCVAEQNAAILKNLVITMILLWPALLSGMASQCGESWSRMPHLRLRAGADPLWYSQHPNIISLHVMYKKSTICIQILLWFIIFPFYFDVALLLMLCCVIMMCYVSIAQILPLTMMVATTDERFSERSRHRVI